MRKKISVLLCLLLLFTAIMPQTAFAGISASSGDDRAQNYSLKVCGGPEAASESSIRVYWADLDSPSQEYRMSWKRDGESKWNTADVKAEEGENGLRSYLLTGLAADTQYDITVATISLNAKGEKVCGRALELKGQTYVTTPEYENYSATSDGTYLESVWNVFEKNAVLKVYRADSRDGEYKLVGQEDGREDLAHSNFKDGAGKVIFRDETVEPGKTYYYKAVSEVTLSDGKILRGESSRAYQLTSRLKPYGDYTIRQLNQKGTYARNLTWKITSSPANYKTRFVKKEITLAVRSSKTGKIDYVKPASVQYSYNGRNYYNMKSTLMLKPGKTIYLRLNMKNRTWIRKDGAGYLKAGLRYYYNDKEGSRAFTEHWLDARFGMNNQVLGLEGRDWGDDPGYESGAFFGEEWEDAYRVTHGHGVTRQGDLTAMVTEDETVVLAWSLCPLAESYALRYGTSEEAAKNSKPVILSKNQFSYEVKGLENGESYYFLLSERSCDETGTEAEELREFGTVVVPADGWSKVGYVYHPHLVPDLTGNVSGEDSVILGWERCSYAAGYKIYYGTSEAEALASTPAVIDQRWIEGYRFEGLKKGETYHFILVEISEDRDGNRQDLLRPHGSLSLTIPA